MTFAEDPAFTFTHRNKTQVAINYPLSSRPAALHIICSVLLLSHITVPHVYDLTYKPIQEVSVQLSASPLTISKSSQLAGCEGETWLPVKPRHRRPQCSAHGRHMWAPLNLGLLLCTRSRLKSAVCSLQQVSSRCGNNDFLWMQTRASVTESVS